jgi:ribosomal protein L11 methyltransferase
VELAAYGPSADRVLAVFPNAFVTTVEEGWEDRWREFHHGVSIDPLWVGPPWEDAPAGATAVVIDPGRAFGTGAHPSTRLALELLLDEERGGLLDVGCGSGVISIAAAKLGFGPVVAVDVDDVAVEVTRENAAANEVDVDVRVADARESLPPARLAVANISLELVVAAAAALQSERLITAGYLASDSPSLPGFAHARRVERDGWAADAFSRAR